jgi:hypothetical protein
MLSRSGFKIRPPVGTAGYFLSDTMLNFSEGVVPEATVGTLDLPAFDDFVPRLASSLNKNRVPLLLEIQKYQSENPSVFAAHVELILEALSAPSWEENVTEAFGTHIITELVRLYHSARLCVLYVFLILVLPPDLDSIQSVKLPFRLVTFVLSRFQTLWCGTFPNAQFCLVL